MKALGSGVLLSTRRGDVVTLTLNDPARCNALSAQMLGALQMALDELLRDTSLRCVVIAAAGPAFCAGHDLNQLSGSADEADLRALFARCSEVMLSLRALPVPVIAQVQGAAVAAGCQLVAACDLAVAATTARFAVSGIDLGLFCSTPAVALSRAIAGKPALDMLLTGRFVGAEEALARGLVNRVVEGDRLADATAAYAADICRKSSEAVRTGKAMFYAQQELPLDEAYRFAGEVMARNMLHGDAQTGVAAFLRNAADRRLEKAAAR